MLIGPRRLMLLQQLIEYDYISHIVAYLRPRRLYYLYQILEHKYPSHILAYLGILDPKLFRVYRCKTCNKLLAKGFLNHKDDVLEVKCRGCSKISLFTGEDAEILEKRSILFKKGLLPNPDKDI